MAREYMSVFRGSKEPNELKAAIHRGMLEPSASDRSWSRSTGRPLWLRQLLPDVVVAVLLL